LDIPGRPLPQLTPENEFFWTAGADGVLRIQECQSCRALIHPPAPVCRYCRSHDMGVRTVSGEATLSAFTVNHRFGFPDLPPPYVVAQVAVAEDPRVRLTTNIVECEPDHLELGQTVEVVFEKAQDKAGAVWLPLFRPTAEKKTGPLPVDEIAPQDFGRYVRPPLTTESSRSTPRSRASARPPRPQADGAAAADHRGVWAAVADAGLTFDDIDGMSTYPGLDIAGMGEGGVGVEGTRTASDVDQRRHGHLRPGGSVIAAMMATATGMACHVLCSARCGRRSADDEGGRCPAGRPPRAGRCRSAQRRPLTRWRSTHNATSNGTAPRGRPSAGSP
jgi:uncharacterized OB-fold protein